MNKYKELITILNSSMCKECDGNGTRDVFSLSEPSYKMHSITCHICRIETIDGSFILGSKLKSYGFKQSINSDILINKLLKRLNDEYL